jgi:hypothetical protein
MGAHSQGTHDARRFIRRVAKLVAMSLAIVSMASCTGSGTDNSPTSGNIPSRVYTGTFSPTGPLWPPLATLTPPRRSPTVAS